MVHLLLFVILAQTWNVETSGATASLRGVSAVSERVVWASGTEGTVIRTVNGGATWIASKVPGAESLDFRGVRAFSSTVALLMSSGEGGKSVVYKTTDGGGAWKLLLRNPDDKGFFDGIAFWNVRNGLILGDPVNGSFVILKTADGGNTWTRQKLPPSIDGEGAFAASNSSLVLSGRGEVWFGTGGKGGARVFHSTDGGASWTVTSTPIRNDAPGSGIFSLAFGRDGGGVAVGGDYTNPKDAIRNIAITGDRGADWSPPHGSPRGYRSAVAIDSKRKTWIVVGPSGSEVSSDSGATWRQFDSDSYNSLSLLPGKAGWAVGARGRVAKLSWPHPGR